MHHAFSGSANNRSAHRTKSGGNRPAGEADSASDHCSRGGGATGRRVSFTVIGRSRGVHVFVHDVLHSFTYFCSARAVGHAAGYQ
jgi:hypothetical protein